MLSKVKNMPHRTYKNPPIVEALCEFTFTPAGEWNPTLPAELHQLVQEYYDGEPRQANIKIVTTNSENNSVTIQNDLRVQLPTKDWHPSREYREEYTQHQRVETIRRMDSI